MAKFHGKLGFFQTSETAPGVYTPVITERDYTGDIIKNVRRWEPNGQVNDNIAISNRISVIYDIYAETNLSNIRYVAWLGSLWKIISIEVERPRLILTLGGRYDGE